MVFDWFKRNLQPEPPAAEGVEEDRAETAPPGGTESRQALNGNPADPGAADPGARVNPGSEEAAPAPPPPAPAPTPAPAPDDDALAWARQAYARLKAEQQAQKAGAQSPGGGPGAGNTRSGSGSPRSQPN
jgi:fused signal recognition particle receptor